MAPKEYMNFMRRATVFRALGRTRQAIKDYTHVLDLRPDFTQVRAGIGGKGGEEGVLRGRARRGRD
jgi:hypothetical protein